MGKFLSMVGANVLAIWTTYVHVRMWRDPAFQRRMARDNQNPIFSKNFNEKFNRSLLFLAISECAIAMFVDVLIVGQSTSGASPALMKE